VGFKLEAGKLTRQMNEPGKFTIEFGGVCYEPENLHFDQTSKEIVFEIMKM